jgi:hypothetical protein
MDMMVDGFFVGRRDSAHHMTQHIILIKDQGKEQASNHVS